MNSKIVRVIVIAAIAVGSWWFVRGIAWDKIGHALAAAHWQWLAIGVALDFAMAFGIGAAWHVLLAPKYRVPIPRLAKYAIAAYSANAIAPARAGEVLRVWALRERDGVPAHDGAAVVVAEKTIDVLALLVLVAPAPLLLDVPTWVTRTIAIGACAVVAAVFALAIAVERLQESERWLGRLVAGMHVLRSPRRFAVVLAIKIATWIFDATTILVVARALDLPLPVAGAPLILFTSVLAIAPPSTPAQVGALELGVLAATRLLGIADEPALAFALLYHATQVIPVVIVGLVLAPSEIFGRHATRTDAPAGGRDAKTGAMDRA